MNLSFSTVDLWRKCTFAFKIRQIDKIYGLSSIHSVFGSTVHDTLKSFLLSEINDEQIDSHFKNFFRKELKELPQERKEKLFTDPQMKEMFQHMTASGPNLCRAAIKALSEKFPQYRIVQVEQEFVEPILLDVKGDYNFKGVIDLVLQTPDGMYHVLDWKSCAWGWKATKKSSKWVTYQLTYYKHFFALQNNIDLSNVFCHFGLIKRTAKKDNIEIFEVKVGPKKIKNALKVVNNLIYNTEKNHFPKNKLSCKYCDYYKTQWCP
jgi:hypothetical protein